MWAALLVLLQLLVSEPAGRAYTKVVHTGSAPESHSPRSVDTAPATHSPRSAARSRSRSLLGAALPRGLHSLPLDAASGGRTTPALLAGEEENGLSWQDPPLAEPAPSGIRVGPGHPYQTVAKAVAAAVAGDTIRVGAGVYPGGLVVDRSVVLLGEPGAILDGGRVGTVVTLAADAIELRGFLIRESGRSLDRDDAAVKVVRGVGCQIVGNRIEGSLHGIYLLEARGTLIEANEIEGDPVLVEARRGNGIHLFNSSGNRIERNRVRGTRDGIYFSFASHNTVSENAVSGTRYGLHYMYSDDNLFSGNHFTRNAAGAAIMFSKRLVFRENLFAEHIGYRAYGVLLQTSEGVIAERNRIEGNLVGIFFDNAIGSVFTENLVVGNGIGIEMLTSAEGNTFTENVITGNRTAVRTARGGGKNAWARAGRGNYWGDRGIYDLDGDGIGDSPYRVGDPFATLAGLRPVLEIFAGTPAALALSWAEQAFPVFGLPRVEDPAPLVRVPEGVLGWGTTPELERESGAKRAGEGKAVRAGVDERSEDGAEKESGNGVGRGSGDD